MVLLKSQWETEMSIVRTQIYGVWQLRLHTSRILIGHLEGSHRYVLKKMPQLSKIKGRTIISLSGKGLGNFQRIIIPAQLKGLEKKSNNCFLLTTSSPKKHHAQPRGEEINSYHIKLRNLFPFKKKYGAS